MTPEQLADFCPHASPLYDGLVMTFTRYNIGTPVRQAAFLGQYAEETAGFTKLHEIFDYTPSALLTFFGKHLTPEQAAELGRQSGEAFVPAARQATIASMVYAGRMGNGDAASGDGSAFRGRGLPMLTGRIAYLACGTALGVDFIARPTLLEIPQYAALAGGWEWDTHGLNALADAGDFQQITQVINGGLNGLDQRVEWWHEAQRALGVQGV